jgi:hypothetical protein
MAGIATRPETEQVLTELGHDTRIRGEAIEPEGWLPLLAALTAVTAT